ncbi:MAG: MBL fold metallo-hydrolase [Roseburia sp.]|nr:MBL fold metallo-hydrolase [Roseburia sp.]MCM1243988.1 MBL fold metallo-hydrolase [Roseburia sp.]
MKITWFGTASLLIENEDDKILIDPFLPLRGAVNHPSLLDYRQADSILITHGHIDHLGSIPKILHDADISVYCSQTPANTLEKKNVDPDMIALIRPDDVLRFGSITVAPLPGKHIRFDAELVRHTLLNFRILRHFPNFLYLLFKNGAFMEKNETLAFQIKADGKTILVLGSLNLDENTQYPTHVDMLVLPYQGATDLVTPALSIIEKIKPRTVLLDHFDDAFPPISAQVDTRPLKKALSKRYPDLSVIKPTAGKPITLLSCPRHQKTMPSTSMSSPESTPVI